MHADLARGGGFEADRVRIADFDDHEAGFMVAVDYHASLGNRHSICLREKTMAPATKPTSAPKTRPTPNVQ